MVYLLLPALAIPCFQWAGTCMHVRDKCLFLKFGFYLSIVEIDVLLAIFSKVSFFLILFQKGQLVL
jgi:hypothetical protein